MQIFELFGSILLKDSGVESKLDKIDKKGQSVSKGMGLSFGSMASAALKFGSVLGIGLGIKGFVDDAAEAEAGVKQLETVLTSTKGASGMTAKAVTDLASSLQKVTKFSDDEILKGQNLLLTFTKIGKDVFPMATETMLNMATALGTDASGSAIQLGKALNDPIKGITALQRVGVTFTQAQKDSIAAMIKHGDVAGAQKVILKELETEFGNSAKAAGTTFAGKLVILKNQFGEVKEAIGGKLLPVLGGFLTWVLDKMPQIQDFIGKAMDIIGKAFDTVANFVKTNLIPVFNDFWNWIKPHIPEIKEIVKIAFDAIKAVMKIVGDYITTVVIPVYKNMAEWFFQNFPKIKDAVMKAYDYIKPSFDNLVKVIKESVMPIIMGLLDVVRQCMPGIKAIFEVVFKVLVWLIKVFIDDIANFIKVIKGIYDFIKPGLDLVAGLFNGIFGGIKALIQGVIDIIDEFNGKKIEDKESTVTVKRKVVTYGGTGDDSDVPYVAPDNTGLGPGYANGTRNATPGAHWVGEDGPEIVNFKGGETVTNAKDSAKVTDDKPLQLFIIVDGKELGSVLVPHLDRANGSTIKLKARSVGV